MTRDELIEKVANNIGEGIWGNIGFDRFHEQQKKYLRQGAKIAVNTIFEVLQEPTEKMKEAAYPIIAKNVWPRMLNASPLAKDG